MLFDIANKVNQINKWMAKRWPSSIQGCLSRLSQNMAYKKWKKKKRSSKRQCRSEFPRRGSKTKYEVMYLTWVMVFLRLRRKINNWKIYHRPIVAVYMKILLLSVWKESITENFVKRNFGSFRRKTIYYITIPLRHRKLIHKKVPYLL